MNRDQSVRLHVTTICCLFLVAATTFFLASGQPPEHCRYMVATGTAGVYSCSEYPRVLHAGVK